MARLLIALLILFTTSLSALATSPAYADDGYSINNGPSDSGWGNGCCW